jgi:hypothetical protein
MDVAHSLDVHIFQKDRKLFEKKYLVAVATQPRLLHSILGLSSFKI